jgi:hypothetical protein
LFTNKEIKNMAKTFQELEEEEMRRRKENMEKAQTLEEYRREKRRQEREALRLSNIYNKEVYEPFLAGRTPAQVVEQMRSEQKTRSDADVARAREDMESGKTSSLVGKAGQEGDPYAGKGKSPITFKSQAEADKSGLTRYNLDEPKGFAEFQQKQGPVEVRKATASRQVFKAMVQGDPTQDQVFDTKKEAEAYLKQTGQKGAVAGVRVSGTLKETESAAAKYKARAEEGRQAMVAEKEKPEKERQRVEAAKNRAFDTRYERATAQYGREMDPKKLYEQNLAERGLRNPASGANTAERRRIQEENDRERMADFRTAISARERAARSEGELVRDYRNYKKSARKARGAGDAQAAVEYERQASRINEMVGGNISNVAARRRVLEEGARNTVQRELQTRANLRREINAKRTTANPEASMFDMTEPSGDAMSQPLGLVSPSTAGGIGFGAISESNAPTAPTTSVAPPTTPAVGEASVTPPTNPFEEAAQQEAEKRSKGAKEKETKSRLDQIAKLTEQINSLAPRPKTSLAGMEFGGEGEPVVGSSPTEQAELKSKYDKLWLERDKLMAVDEGRVFKSLQEAEATGLPEGTIVYINDKPVKL